MHLPPMKDSDIFTWVLFLIFLMGIIVWVLVTLLMKVLPSGIFLLA